MTTDRVPDVPRRWSPQPPAVRGNPRPAWEAAWHLLADGKSHPRVEIIAAMREANPIAYRTARSILQNAVTDGLLQVVDRDDFGRPTLKRPM